MSDRLPHQSQIRAHKKNIGAIKALDAHVQQLYKDRKRSILNIDQEVLDTHKFLEQVKHNSGTTFTYEEVYPTNDRRRSLRDSKSEKVRKTKSARMEEEVRIRKQKEKERFNEIREQFFEAWAETFQIDLQLDSWKPKVAPVINMDIEIEDIEY